MGFALGFDVGVRQGRRRLEGYSEICVLGVGGQIGDFCFCDVAEEGLLDVGYAVVYVGGCALGEHFYCCVGQVADEAGEPVAIGYSVGGEAEADALNAASEDYVLGDHFSYVVCRISYVVLRIAYLVLRIAWSDLRYYIIGYGNGEVFRVQAGVG